MDIPLAHELSKYAVTGIAIAWGIAILWWATRTPKQ